MALSQLFDGVVFPTRRRKQKHQWGIRAEQAGELCQGSDRKTAVFDSRRHAQQIADDMSTITKQRFIAVPIAH